MHLTVFDLDGGPAVLVRSPEGRAGLIGGAQSASSLELVLGRRLPPLGARLDGLILSTASGLDGLAGTLEVIPAARVYRCVEFPALGAGSRLRDALRLADVPLELFSSERELKVGNAARLRVVARSETACALELQSDGSQLWIEGGK